MTRQKLPPPKSPELANALMLAERARRSGDFRGAEQICRTALARAPDDVTTLNFLGLLVSMRGGLNEAEQLLGRALALAPDYAVLCNNLGNVHYKKKNAAAAIDLYRRATELDPGYSDAFYNLGIALREVDDAAGAMAAQRQSFAANPANAEALTQIGLLLIESGKPNEAIEYLDLAIAKNPKCFGAHFYRGSALKTLARTEEALLSLRTAVALRPNSAEAAYLLAMVLSTTGREEEAVRAYGAAIEIDPGYIFAHKDLSNLLWTMGRKDQSFSSYAYARTKVGERPDLLLAEADQLMFVNQAERATELLTRARTIAPDRGDIANALGRAFTMRGQFEPAAEQYQSASDLEPGVVSHPRELAVMLMHAREPQRALKALERAREISPFDQMTLALLSLLYRELGDGKAEEFADVRRLVRVFDLPAPPGFRDMASFNGALAEELVHLHTRKSEPFDQTLRGGTQTMGQLFGRGHKHVELLREQIEAAVSEYVDDMPEMATHPLFGRKQREFSFSGSWSCRLASGGYHTNHLHPAGWLSSAYYVALPDAVEDTASNQGWLKFGESNLRFGKHDKPERLVQPAVGRLVLFPSYFWHGTVPFGSDETRLTVAFDVVPGRMGSPRGAEPPL